MEPAGVSRSSASFIHSDAESIRHDTWLRSSHGTKSFRNLALFLLSCGLHESKKPQYWKSHWQTETFMDNARRNLANQGAGMKWHEMTSKKQEETLGEIWTKCRHNTWECMQTHPVWKRVTDEASRAMWDALVDTTNRQWKTQLRRRCKHLTNVDHLHLPAIVFQYETANLISAEQIRTMREAEKTKKNTSTIHHHVQRSGNTHSFESYTKPLVRTDVDRNSNLSGDTEIGEPEEVTRGNSVGDLAHTESGDDADESDNNSTKDLVCDQMGYDTDSDGKSVEGNENTEMEGVIYGSSGGDGVRVKMEHDTGNSSVGGSEIAKMEEKISSSIASDEPWAEADEAAEKALENLGKNS